MWSLFSHSVSFWAAFFFVLSLVSDKGWWQSPSSYGHTRALLLDPSVPTKQEQKLLGQMHGHTQLDFLNYHRQNSDNYNQIMMISIGNQCILLSKKSKSLSVGVVLVRLLFFYRQIHPRGMEWWGRAVKMNLCYTFIQVRILSWGLLLLRELPQPSG